MALSATVLNAGNDASAGEIAEISLHTADPGGTGANEVSGSRVTGVTWPGSTAGSTSVDTSHDVPGGTTVSHVGFWAADGTTAVGDQAVDASESWTNAGTAELTTTITTS